MAEKITYAKAGVTPGWQDLRIIHADGTDDAYVVEANSEEGWLVRYRRDERGKLVLDGEEVATERVECRFTIEPKLQPA